MHKLRICEDGDYFYLTIKGYKIKSIGETEFYNKLERISKYAGVHLIAIRPDIVVSPLNLVIAVRYALRAFRKRKNISDKLPIEVLLYLSGRREISKVLKMFPPRGVVEECIICILGKDHSLIRRAENLIINEFDAKENLTAFLLTEEKISKVLEIYDISQGEISNTYTTDIRKTLTYLIATRSALFAVRA